MGDAEIILGFISGSSVDHCGFMQRERRLLLALWVSPDMNETLSTPLRLNAYALRFSAPQFTAFRYALPNPQDLSELRDRVKADWFVYWREGTAWGLPRLDHPKITFGKPQPLDVHSYEGLTLLGARTSQQLQDFLPRYEPLSGRGRGFRFVAQNTELVTQITKNWSGVPPLLCDFEIRPRFNCETRLIELQEQALRAVLLVDISMRWEIHADLEALAKAGVDLTGLYVVRREPIPGQRRLLGQVKRVQNGEVYFAESYENIASVSARDVRLEPGKQSFVRSLTTLLGNRGDRFWQEYDYLEADYLGGNGFDACLKRLAPTLSKHKGIYLAPGISVAVGEQVELAEVGKPLAVNYCFDPGKTKQNTLPWNGLGEFGPYDRDTFPRKAPKLLLVCPNDAQNRVEQAAHKFKDGIANSVFSRGFARMFHLVNLTVETCPVDAVRASAANIASVYAAAVEKTLQRRSDYDGALVIVPDRFAELPDASNPYLFAKAVLLTNGIPVQEARLSTITRSDSNLAYVFQNISVALYAKMGGVPWTVNQDQTVNDEVVIGMGLIETSGSRFQEKQRVVGITTVFRGDGNYLLANVARECQFEEYRAQLKDTMIEVLREVKQRNGWRAGDSVRVVFHASKPLRDLEVDELMRECVEQAAPEQVVQFAFLDVLQDHPFHLFDPNQKGKPAQHGPRKGAMAPARGTALQLGKQTWLLSTNGVSQIKRQTSPLPAPLLIHLHKKSTGCDLPYLTDQVLKFTSLTWRSTQPAAQPVTIYYSSLIADLLTRLKAVPGWSPNVLNTKLRASKWFL
jgi:Piwi domain